MLHAHRSSSLLLLFAILIGLISSSTSFALIERERDQLRMMPEWLPYQGCQDTKYLKQCFTWTTEDCEMTVGESTESCLSLSQSDWMRGGGTLDLWQEKIANCVVRDVRAKRKSQMVDSVNCQNKGALR